MKIPRSLYSHQTIGLKKKSMLYFITYRDWVVLEMCLKFHGRTLLN